LNRFAEKYYNRYVAISPSNTAIAEAAISKINSRFATIFLVILTNRIRIYNVAGIRIIWSISLLSGVKSRSIRIENNISVENERIQDIVF
jgi:hypothetical protein